MLAGSPCRYQLCRGKNALPRACTTWSENTYELHALSLVNTEKMTQNFVSPKGLLGKNQKRAVLSYKGGKMVEKRSFNSCLILQEFSDSESTYWFDFKKKKFLHNIDTFYYSVKFSNDFTSESTDHSVLQFRKFFHQKQEQLYENYGDSLPIYFDGIGNLNLLPCSFSRFYNICLEKPEHFHIFLAPKVPKGSGPESVTCELIVQIRSYMLWMYGVHESFQRSFEYVQGIADTFGLSIAFAQENRIDYCWHSNYLSNPERFFNMENFYKMRVDRYKGAHFNTEKVGSEDYLIDYVALGKRGQKCFVRIYLKSKEVVEMGYKPFFFKIWLFNGLINRYDLYCLEQCFRRRSWGYLDIARLQFYAEYGHDENYRNTCRNLVSKNEFSLNVTDQIQRLADYLTPKINLVMNVEFQTMRKASKTYCLVPFKDNSGDPVTQRIYDYLDNRAIITEYLTRCTLRLVEPQGDSNKSRRPDCGFWKALRNCKGVDVLLTPEQIHLVRDYSRKLNADVMKRGIINKAVMLGFYQKGLNTDHPARDAMEAVLTLNDNDIKAAMRYKQKKSRRLSGEEMSGLVENFSGCEFKLVDDTGSIYNNNTIQDFYIQY